MIESSQNYDYKTTNFIHQQEENMRIAIIGSGLSGLTAGVCLAQAGHQVDIYEQYHRTGGVTAPFEKDGFKWDLGQLLIEGIGVDEPLGLILLNLGVLDKIHAIKDDRGYVFPDFQLKKPAEYQGIRWRFDQLKTIFPQEMDGFERYWRDYIRFTRLLTRARRTESSQGITGLRNKVQLYYALLPFIFRLKWDAQRLMDSYFSSRELQCVFISILADFFTSPTQFPGLGVFALNSEAAYEHRVPKLIAPSAETLYHYSIFGGISTLVDALVRRIEQLGGNLLTGIPVTRISVESNRITGVVVSDSSFHPAEVVIASGGARETFLKLVGEEWLPQEFIRKLHGMTLMDSVFMVHLGLDFDPSPWLHGAVTYFYSSYDIEGGIDEAHRGIYHQGERGFVVHVPSLHTPQMAPPGHHAMTIYTICPDRLKDGSWEENKEAFADDLIGYAQEHIPELSRHVCARHILTPEDFRKRTNLEHHAFGGIAPILGAPRIPHRTPVEGLWFVGAQSESGGGVNSVILGAYRVARSIVSNVLHG